MFIGIIETHCPNCSMLVSADEHDCGCIFGSCEFCNTDFEIDNNCLNKERK